MLLLLPTYPNTSLAEVVVETLVPRGQLVCEQVNPLTLTLTLTLTPTPTREPRGTGVVSPAR